MARLARLASNVVAPTPSYTTGTPAPPVSARICWPNSARVVGVGEHFVGAGLLRRLGFLGSRDCGDDPGAEQFRPLRQDQSYAAGAGVYQHRVAGLHGIDRLEQVMGSQALHQMEAAISELTPSGT